MSDRAFVDPNVSMCAHDVEAEAKHPTARVFSVTFEVSGPGSQPAGAASILCKRHPQDGASDLKRGYSRENLSVRHTIAGLRIQNPGTNAR
jgi:hypothetical protein